jgi:beta-lactamase regulating signal transducer with metallopeptidase domain
MISAAAPVLLEAAARALFAALVLWIGLRLLRVRNVPVQKTAWGLVLALALAMPLLMRIPLPAWAQVRLPVLAWPQNALPSSPAPAARLAAAPSPALTSSPDPAIAASPLEDARNSAQTAPEPSSAPAVSMSAFDPPMRLAAEKARAAAPDSASASTRHSAPGASFSPLSIAWSFYLVVGAALLLRLLLGLATSLRLWLHARPVEVPARIGHDPLIPVRASRRIASPVNVGSGIVLPADYASWDAEKLRVVLAHEGSHVRQRDFYLQLLAGLYSALLWFSPLGWWLKRKLSELGEAICDRAALDAASSPSDYAQLLLEFAALPRPPLTGVAMAHAHHLSARIERLLNDASLRQSFGRSRRAVAALLLVPAALLASTVLMRVHAAEAPRTAQAAQAQSQTAPPPPAQDSTAAPAQPAQPAAAGQSSPDQNQVTDSTQQAPPPSTPEPAPAASPAPSLSPVAPAPPDSGQDQTAPVAPVPPMPAVQIPPIHIPPINMPAIVIPKIDIPPIEISGIDSAILSSLDGPIFLSQSGMGGCEACALVGDPGTSPHYFGYGNNDDDRDQIDKARKLAHGHFFWFREDGKSYIIDDPAIVSQIESMQSRIDDLRKQMRDLRDQQRGEGAQMREEARKLREAAQNLPKPDLSDAMAQLNAAVASLKSAQGDTVTREQLQEIQRRLSEMQSKLIASEVKVNWNSADLSKWSEEMGRYGQQMGALGSQMGQAAKENHEKIRSLIDESIKNGKARPVD